jgi:hypothetical protein
MDLTGIQSIGLQFAEYYYWAFGSSRQDLRNLYVNL